MKKRILSLLLAIVMVAGMLPMPGYVHAADGTTNTVTDFSVTYFSESDRLDDGWSNDTERDLDGVSGGDVQDEGKTAWEDSDEIFVTLTSQKYGTQTVALIFDRFSDTWAADGYFRYAEGETPDISAIYAPCYERTTDGSLQLKDGMQLLGMTEYIAADCEIVDGVISISFDGAIRDYSRLRIVGLPNQTLTVTTTDFIPAGYGYVTAPTSYTLTTDKKGNAYLYGTFIEDATVSVKQGNVTLADYAFTAAKDFSNGTEQGKSYVLDARPVIDLSQYSDGATVDITENSMIIGDGNEYNLTLNILEDATVIFDVGTSGVKLNAPITVADGKTLTLLVAGDAEHIVNGGISLGNGSNVIIEGDRDQESNKLTVTATDGNAGIGANNGVTAGDITIRNARVDATGSSKEAPELGYDASISGAVIGTSDGSMGDILIENSIIVAEGGYYENISHAAAIGIGYVGSTMGNITLKDSQITASNNGDGLASVIGAGATMQMYVSGTMGDIVITNTDLNLSMAIGTQNYYAAIIGSGIGHDPSWVNMGKIIFTDVTQAELDEIIPTWLPSDFNEYGAYALGRGYSGEYNQHDAFGGVWVSNGNGGTVQIGNESGYYNSCRRNGVWVGFDHNFEEPCGGTCRDCGVEYFVVHTEGTEATDNGDGTHSYNCSECEETVTEAHSTEAAGDKVATCQEKAYCSVCGEYGEVDRNNHASEEFTYTPDEQEMQEHKHDKKYACCGAFAASEEHTLTWTATDNVLSAECDVCGATGTATITAESKTYDGTPVLANVEKTGILVSGYYGPETGEIIYCLPNGQGLVEAPANAGDYLVVLHHDDTFPRAQVHYTIYKADPTYTAPAVNAGLVYTGEAQPLVSGGGAANNGEMQYAMGTDSTTAPTDGWSTDIPEATHAGTYYVWYKVLGDSNHTDITPQCKTVIIAKASASVTTEPTGISGLAYTGEAQELVTAGSAGIGSTMQYAVGDSSTTAPTTGWASDIPQATDAGTYYVWYRVQGDSNHKSIDPVSMTVTIDPIELTLKLTDCYKEYDGTADLTSFYAELDGFIFYDEGSYVQPDVLDYDDVYDDVSVDESKLTVTLSGSDVGSYATAHVSGITLIGEDAGNYTIAAEIAEVPISGYYGDFEIGMATITITSLDQNVELGADLDQNAYTVEGLPQGYEIRGVVLEKDGNRITVNTAVIVIVNNQGAYVTDYFHVNTYDDGIITETCAGHSFNADGFCATGQCQVYEAAKRNDNGTEEEYDDYYEISNAGQLFWFAEYVNNVRNDAKAALTANITIPEGKEWTPIGSSYPAYTGSFDGQGYTISGLYVNQPERDYVGLFGNVSYNPEIKNLAITNSTFIGRNYVGALAGYGEVTASNIAIGENVIVQGNSYVGGMIGYNSGTLRNSYACSDSLVGYMYPGYGSIENCYFLSETNDDYGTIGKTADQFASGEVAYLLQAGQVGEPLWDEENEDYFYDDEGNYIYGEAPHVWGQTIGTDDYPILGGEKVYFDENADPQYYNEKAVILSVILSKGTTAQYTVDGQTVTVTHDKPCTVGYLDKASGKYIAITAVADQAGSYRFTAPKGVTEVLIALKGDVNQDGRITASDIARTNAHIKDATTLTAEELFAADVNGDGQVSNDDIQYLNLAILGMSGSSITW